jgi:outer membrane protein W
MRKTGVVLGLALVAASPVLAQSNQGAVGLDAMIAPTTGLGFAFYVTDGLSIRPWLGLGYSDYSGFFANVGAQLRFETAAMSRVSPYLSATAQYTHQGSVPVTANARYGSYGTPLLALQSDVGLFGAGAGVRYQVGDDLALFAEGRLMHATAPLGSYAPGWGSIGINDRTRADIVLGLTYILH